MPPEVRKFTARAWFLGSRLDVRRIVDRNGRYEKVAPTPVTLRIEQGGYAVLFRFGVVVLFDLNDATQDEFLASIGDAVVGLFKVPEREDVEIEVATGEIPERLHSTGALLLQVASVDRLQVVAHILAKSAVLSYYEQSVAGVFDRIDELGEHLRRGVIPKQRKELLAEIGSVLLIQTRMVGRAEVSEKPEITWDRPELDRLYEHLALEYELRDRDVALSRKLDLISDIAETYLNLLYSRQTIRVEWYIVILIIFEILLTFYEWSVLL